METAEPVLEAMRSTLAGKTALLITHNPQEALALADEVIQAQGPPLRLIRAARTAQFEDAEALIQWLLTPFPPYK